RPARSSQRHGFSWSPAGVRGRVRTDLTSPTLAAPASIPFPEVRMPDVEATARMAVPDHVSRVARLRMSSLGLVSMLIIQFVLGVIYSLYGKGPTATESVGMFSSPVLALHVILFFLLVIAGLGQLIRAVGARHKLALWMSALGLLAILAAGF